MDEFKEFLISWICNQNGLQEDTIECEKNMFENGYVDSLGLFGLLLDIEEKFNIVLTEDDILDDSASTINGLSSILHRRKINN